MRKLINKGMAVLVILAVAGAMAACSANNQKGAAPSTEPAATNTNSASSDESKAAAESTAPAEPASVAYPLETDVTLMYWAQLHPGLNGLKTDHNDNPAHQEWQKVTGVTMEFINPPLGQHVEAFNVLLASGELPDIIEWDWLKFPGGPEKAINDGYILKLNDAIEQYAPNLRKYLQEHPDVDKQIKTDSGAYYAFPFIRGDDILKVFQGPMLRKDWLDELSLPVPTTIDEWYATLKAFKDKKGATAPLSMATSLFTNGAFVGAYGIVPGFYLEDGVVRFGAIDPRFKDFLALMRQWYEEGLYDKNFATIDAKMLDANITSGAAGATVANSGGGMGKWMPILQSQDPKAVLTGAPYPVLNKGDKPMFGQKDFFYNSPGAVAISAQSNNVELAVKMLDYGYSEEGQMFFNFGTEGTAYTMVNGYPTYTDLILKNPDNLAVAQALALYARASYNGPFVQDKRYIEQYLAYPQQKEAIELWQTDADKYILPPITPNQEESTEFAAIMNDVNTLYLEMIQKIILGVEPVSSFDDYVEKLKSVKIDRAIEIQNAALARYNNR